MLSGAQHRVVTLTKLQLRNLDAVDENAYGFKNSKIRSSGHNQTSVIARLADAESDLSSGAWIGVLAAKLHAIATMIPNSFILVFIYLICLSKRRPGALFPEDPLSC